MTQKQRLNRPRMKRRVDAVRRCAVAIWQTPQLTYFTDHTVRHSDRIIRLLDSMCGLLREPLNEDEAYVLLCAAYLHDIGMQWPACLDSEAVRATCTPEMVAAARNDDNRRDEIIRDCHHLLSEEWIKSDRNRCSLEDEFVDEVLLVIRGHRKENVAQYSDATKGSALMRVRLLAALLRVADELDLDYRRVNLDILEKCDISDQSKAHWWKCHYVESVDVDEHGRVRVRFKFSTRDQEEVSRIIPRLVLGDLLKKVDEEGLVDALWPYLPLRLDGEPLVDPPSSMKRPLPVAVLGIFKKQMGDMLLAGVAATAVSIGGFGAGVIHVAIGDSPEGILIRAANLQTQGDTERALMLLSRGVDLYPGHAQLNALLAAVSVRQGNWSQATVAAQRAVDGDPPNYTGRMVLGGAAIRMKNYDDALRQLRIAEWRAYASPTHPAETMALHIQIGTALGGLGDYRHAARRLEEARTVGEAFGIAAANELAAQKQELAELVRNSYEEERALNDVRDVVDFQWHQVLGEWIVDEPIQYVRPTAFPEGITLAGGTGWADYTFECQFQPLNEAAGFFLRADAHATMGLMMQFTRDKLRRHQLLLGNYAYRPISEVALPAYLDRQTWYSVRFVAAGSTITTFLDGVVIDQWTGVPNDYTCGRIGFRLCPTEFSLYRSPKVTITKEWTLTDHSDRPPA